MQRSAQLRSFRKGPGTTFAQVFAPVFEMFGNMCITTIFCPVSEAINFEIKIRFHQVVFQHDQKCQ